MIKETDVFFLLGLILLIVPFNTLSAQEKEGMVKYTPDFKFKDGIYLSFDQVKLNDPIAKAKVLTSVDYNAKDFFKQVMEMDKIYYYDDMGVRQEVDSKSIWGYSRNGVLNVQIQGNFNRITFVGSICHFVADVVTSDPRYYSPYSYYDPYYYGNYYSPYNSYYSPYSYPYRQSGMTRSELKQYLIDFESGKTLEFNEENTELLLMKDPPLYDEYKQLSRKKKKELMFFYIRKFNENNPLYIPVEH
jgi:hypothetical protein